MTVRRPAALIHSDGHVRADRESGWGAFLAVVVGALLVAFAVVFVAECGDKTAMLTLALAEGYGAWPVREGVSVMPALMNAVSVGVGTGIAHVIRKRGVEVGAGVALMGLRGAQRSRGLVPPGDRR